MNVLPIIKKKKEFLRQKGFTFSLWIGPLSPAFPHEGKVIKHSYIESFVIVLRLLTLGYTISIPVNKPQFPHMEGQN
jgi:hypothetical protein